MSRVAKKPVSLIDGVTCSIENNLVTIEGKKGKDSLEVHASIDVKQENFCLEISPKKELKSSWAMAGTMRSLLNNMVLGVSEGFEKKLKLIGVGYRANIQGNNLNLVLGFSHPVDFAIPEGIKIEVPTQTELVVSGVSKQLVGQVAAKIRSFRPPEPYKGKGVRYADEQISLKEIKKK